MSPIPKQAFDLPAGFSEIRLDDQCGGQFSIIGSSPPKEYEKGLIAGNLWGTPNVVWLIRELLGPNDLLIDVGANIGCVSVPIARDGNAVLAVEIIPANCLKLQFARLANGLPNLHIFQAGASSEDGDLSYGGTEAWGMVGYGIQEAAALRLDTLIQIASLGSSVVSHSESIIIKIDVEGHEFAVLEGSGGIIAKHRPIILFESIQDAGDTSDSTALKCKNLLASCGYELYLQYGKTLAPRSANDFQEGLVSDYLAIPSERHDIVRNLDVRPLTAVERLSIIAQDGAESSERHVQHSLAASRLLAGATMAHLG